MSWIDKHEPHYRDMAPGRCDIDEGPWDHDPHGWYLKRETKSEIVKDENRIVRIKTETVDWFWCPGRLCPAHD